MNIKSLIQIVNKYLPFVLIIISIKFISLLAQQHKAVIEHPYQIEFREGSSLNLTTALDKGLNPYALENQPFYADNFGILYSAIAYPLTKVFGLNLVTHRMLSAFAIAISLILLFISLRKEKVNISYSIAGSIIFYGCMLFYVTPICRPDALGMMFFLLSCVIPIYYKYSDKSLILAAIFSLLAFYTKQYGILGYGAILGYIFLFVSMRKAILHGIAFGVTLTLSIFIVSQFYECYFYNTTVSMAIAANNNYAYSFDQMRQLLFKYLLGISMIIALYLIQLLVKKYYLKKSNSDANGESIHSFFNIKSFKGPLIQRSANVYVVIALVFCVLLLARLGGNEGTFMTYHFQLLAFFVIVVGLSLSKRMPGLNFLQVPFVAICMYSTTVLITSTGFFKKENAADWEKIKNYLKTPGQIHNDEAIAAEVIFSGRVPYMSGLTGYFNYSTLNENFNKKFPFTAKLKVRQDYFRKLVKSNIETQKFQLIILEKNHWTAKDAVLEQYYSKVDSASVNMYHTEQTWDLFIWEPKKIGRKPNELF